MKIGVILDNEFTVDIRVSNEVRYLKSLGYEMHILCPNFSNKSLFEVVDGVSIHRFNLNKSLKNKLFGVMNILPFYELMWIKRVRRFVKEINPNYLHAHDLYMAKIANKGCSATIPIVLDLHENFPAAILSYKWSSKFPYNLLSQPKAWQNKEREYLGYANRIIILSESFKNFLTYKYPDLNPTNLYVYPNVPDINQMLSFPIKSDIFPKQNRFILFYFGGISKRRGIYTCFEAVKKLSDNIPTLHLLLIGPVDGHEQDTFNKYINDPLLKDRVTHYPWKDLSEFPSYTSISDVCLSPIYKNEQHESGVANKIFQYMLFNKPLIVSNCIPQIEIVEGNSCGVSFKYDSVDDLADKIHLLYNDQKLYKELGENGRRTVIEKYNLEVCGEQLNLLYKSLIRTNS